MNNSKCGTGHLGSCLSFLQILLSLAELGQVEGGNFLGFFNLCLVSLDLSLQFAGQIRHAILVLVVFILLELKFLDAALSLLVTLVSVRSLRLDGSKFNLKLTDATLKLSHCSAATLGSDIIGFSESHLQFVDLGFKSTLGLILTIGMILLSPEFISKTGSINHGSLGLFLRALGLSKHIINLSMHSVPG